MPLIHDIDIVRTLEVVHDDGDMSLLSDSDHAELLELTERHITSIYTGLPGTSKQTAICSWESRRITLYNLIADTLLSVPGNTESKDEILERIGFNTKKRGRPPKKASPFNFHS